MIIFTSYAVIKMNNIASNDENACHEIWNNKISRLSMIRGYSFILYHTDNV